MVIVKVEEAKREEPKKPEQKKVEDKPSGEEKAIRTAITAWAEAWSDKNAKEYLSYYAKDFQVPDRRPRSEWEKERTDRVTKPGAIKVSLTDIRIDVNGDEAVVKFRQNYDSASFKSSSGKTLEMVRRGSRWQIQQERIGR